MKTSILIVMALTVAAILPAQAGHGKYWDKHGVGSEFHGPRDLDLPPRSYVLDRETGDVTGDRIADYIFLVGTKDNRKSVFTRDTFLVVENGKNGRVNKISYGRDIGGVSGKLWLGDIDRNRVDDILVTIATGGSGGTSVYAIVSFKDYKARLLVDPRKFSDGVRLEVIPRDGFKARVYNGDLRKTYYLDLHRQKSEFIKSGTYNQYGEVRNRENGEVDSISLLEPKKIGFTGRYKLVTYQAIWMGYHANTIGQARATWEWKNGRLRLTDLDVYERR